MEDPKYGVDDVEEECKMTEMTASYSEISFDSQASPVGWNVFEDHNHMVLASRPRPHTLDLATTADEDAEQGQMFEFVAEDLETQIKLASPVSRKDNFGAVVGSRGSTPNLYRQALMPQVTSVDPNILNDLEAEARKIATSVDTLTENLAGILHSVSALTVECLETYRDAVCKTCDSVDSNIKAMYQLMAKCEELSKSMKPIYKLAEQIKELKRLLDLFESAVGN